LEFIIIGRQRSFCVSTGVELCIHRSCDYFVTLRGYFCDYAGSCKKFRMSQRDCGSQCTDALWDNIRPVSQVVCLAQRFIHSPTVSVCILVCVFTVQRTYPQ